MRKQLQHGKGKKYSARMQPSTVNICTGCGKQLPPNLNRRKMNEHKCEEK